MKFLLTLLMATWIAFSYAASEDNHSVEPQSGNSTDNIVLTPVGTWIIPNGSTPRGIDCSDSAGEIYISDYSADSIFVYDYTGSILEKFSPPAEVPAVQGICFGTDYILVNNRESGSNIHKYQSEAWSTDFANPASDPMGMDMDATDIIWEIDGAGHILYRMDTSGTVLNQWYVPEPPPSAHALACTVFPVDGRQVILLGGQTWPDFYFYEWDGSTLAFLGAQAIPQASNHSYGAAWCQARETIFWIYKDGGNYGVCEFQISIDVTALDRTTWGAIKASL